MAELDVAAGGGLLQAVEGELPLYDAVADFVVAPLGKRSVLIKSAYAVTNCRSKFWQKNIFGIRIIITSK